MISICISGLFPFGDRVGKHVAKYSVYTVVNANHSFDVVDVVEVRLKMKWLPLLLVCTTVFAAKASAEVGKDSKENIPAVSVQCGSHLVKQEKQAEHQNKKFTTVESARDAG
jgi:hypothetical protein